MRREYYGVVMYGRLWEQKQKKVKPYLDGWD